MALMRWQPFHEMESLQRDMNRMFESLASNDRGSMRQSFMPLAEMEQTENAIHLKVEVPGMKADDIDVQVTREAVMVTGERKSESKSEKNGMKRSEFRYGSFQRTIPLPVPIDNNQATGNYQDGILTLELPKLQKKEEKVTKVNITSGDMQQSDRSQSSGSGNNIEVQSHNGGYGGDAWSSTQPADSESAIAN